MKFAKLIFKNILRNKRRTLLTVSSLAVSLFLIITLATVLSELHRGSAMANPLRLAAFEQLLEAWIWAECRPRIQPPVDAPVGIKALDQA